MSSEKLPLEDNILTITRHSSVTSDQEDKVNALIDNFSAMSPQEFQNACDQMVRELGSFETFRNAVDSVITDKFEKRAKLARYKIADTTKKDAFSTLNDYIVKNTYSTFAELALKGAKIQSQAILDAFKGANEKVIKKMRDQEIEMAKVEAIQKIDEINRNNPPNKVKEIVKIQDNLHQQIEQISSKEYSGEDFEKDKALERHAALKRLTKGLLTNYASQSFDLTCLSIKKDLLSEPSVGARTVKMERYLQIAEVAIKEHNFTVATSIYAALKSGPIDRLHATKGGLSKHAREIIKDLERELSPTKNYTHMRTVVADPTTNSYLTPVIIGTEATYLVDGNEKNGIVQQDAESWTQKHQKVVSLTSPKGNEIYSQELNQNRISYEGIDAENLSVAIKKRDTDFGKINDEFYTMSQSIETRGAKLKPSPIMKAVRSTMYADVKPEEDIGEEVTEEQQDLLNPLEEDQNEVAPLPDMPEVGEYVLPPLPNIPEEGETHEEVLPPLPKTPKHDLQTDTVIKNNTETEQQATSLQSTTTSIDAPAAPVPKPAKPLLIRDTTTDSELIGAIFVQVYLAQVNLKGEYRYIGEAEKDTQLFIEQLKNEMLLKATSKNDEEYIKTFFKGLTHMALAQLNSSRNNINIFIEEKYYKFCENNLLNPEAPIQDINKAIQNKFSEAFVGSDYASGVQEESKKTSKQILKDIKKSLNGNINDLIYSISSAQFIQSNATKVQSSTAENLIKEGKIFTNTGQLKEGYNLDPRTQLIQGLGLGPLTPLEQYILSSLIIEAAQQYAIKNPPKMEDDLDSDTILANKDLTKLAQTHFCMFLNNNESDKKDLLKQVRHMVEKIQKYDHPEAKQESTSTVVMRSIQAGAKRLWSVVNPSSKGKEPSSVDIPEPQEKQSIRRRMTSIMNPEKQKNKDALDEMKQYYGQYFGSKNKLDMQLGYYKGSYTKQQMLGDMQRMRDAVEKLKAMQIPEGVEKLASRDPLAKSIYNECMKIRNNEVNPKSLFADIKRDFDLELSPPQEAQTSIESSVGQEHKKGSQAVSHPWRKATHRCDHDDIEKAVHCKHSGSDSKPSKGMKEQLHIIGGNGVSEESEESEGSSIKKSGGG